MAAAAVLKIKKLLHLRNGLTDRNKIWFLQRVDR